MNHKYTFLYEAADEENREIGFPVGQRILNEFVIDRDANWREVVREFENFISSIYGYRIDLMTAEDRYSGL